jgi:hypothetical protein
MKAIEVLPPVHLKDAEATALEVGDNHLLTLVYMAQDLERLITNYISNL